MFSDRMNLMDIEETVLHHARHSSSTNTFRYMMTHRSQLSMADFFPTDVGSHWVSHGDDLYYLFRGGPFLQPPQQSPKRLHDLQSKDDLAVRDIITALWTNFAATGNPTPDASLGFIWEPSTEDNLHYLDLKPKPTMEADRRQEVRRFHASLPTKVNLALHPHLVQDEDPVPADKVTETAGHTRNAQDEL
ncbi:Bile salt-activated lipase-like 8 [Homarus americanus]|uniref:Bile salt-activated lipase-like 8 n=2 Tax=Homarus americanus TaxID=6706 RepID=A0A8J5JG35_HOMAM|nr:Bile salt-activated lipase-like 8 [Homarus americanus]